MNLKKSTQKGERRFTERFYIPEGIAYFRYLRRFRLIHNFNGPFPMYDIASNSARFECSREINIPSDIELRIKPPGYYEELRIKGKVIRQAGVKQQQARAYVIQFSPFGRGFQYNSLQCKARLDQYIQKMKTKKTSDQTD